MILRLARVKKEVYYKCGCRVEYVMKGTEYDIKNKWRGFLCSEHARLSNEKSMLEERAESDWQREVEGQPVGQDYK